MGDGRHVLDERDVKTRGLQSANRRLTSRSGAADEHLDGLHTVLADGTFIDTHGAADDLTDESTCGLDRKSVV